MSGAPPRRMFLVAGATAAVGSSHSPAGSNKEPSMTTFAFWPSGARLAGQPLPPTQLDEVIDMADTNSWR